MDNKTKINTFYLEFTLLFSLNDMVVCAELYEYITLFD